MKNNQDNQIQSITLCNTYFSKKVSLYAVYNGVPAGEFSRIFVLKVTLQSVRFLSFNCKLQKKLGGAGCTIVAPIMLRRTN